MTNMEKKVNSFRAHLDKFGIEALHVFSTRNYGPFDYLNEINPENSEEHDRFIRKFKDG